MFIFALLKGGKISNKKMDSPKPFCLSLLFKLTLN
jgi:hypothetical protein